MQKKAKGNFSQTLSTAADTYESMISDPLTVGCSILFIILSALVISAYIIFSNYPVVSHEISYSMYCLDIVGRVARTSGFVIATVIGVSGLTSWKAKRRKEQIDTTVRTFIPILKKIELHCISSARSLKVLFPNKLDRITTIDSTGTLMNFRIIHRNGLDLSRHIKELKDEMDGSIGTHQLAFERRARELADDLIKTEQKFYYFYDLYIYIPLKNKFDERDHMRRQNALKSEYPFNFVLNDVDIATFEELKEKIDSDLHEVKNLIDWLLSQSR